MRRGEAYSEGEGGGGSMMAPRRSDLRVITDRGAPAGYLLACYLLTDAATAFSEVTVRPGRLERACL